MSDRERLKQMRHSNWFWWLKIILSGGIAGSLLPKDASLLLLIPGVVVSLLVITGVSDALFNCFERED